VVEFVSPAKFEEYGRRAGELGFVHVASGPMVRSSYHADEFNLPLACLKNRVAIA
jgi:lipoic acid synthetase